MMICLGRRNLSWRVNIWSVVSVLGILLHPTGTEASIQYLQRNPCELESQAVVILHRDISAVGNDYAIVERIPASEWKASGEVQQRRLQEWKTPETPWTVSRKLHGSSENETEKEGDLFYARECACFEPNHPTIYCPNAVDTCLRPTSWYSGEEPMCMNVVPAYGLKRWNVIIAASMFIMLGMFIFLSGKGTYAWLYLASKSDPNYNKNFIDDLVQKDPDEANRLIREFFRRQQQSFEWAINRNQGRHPAVSHEMTTAPHLTGSNQQGQHPLSRPTHPALPRSLALRTKPYLQDRMGSMVTLSSEQTIEVVSQNFTEDHEPTIACAICLNSFREGERVGALKCDHIFHVDCLKLWLGRKNVCPLCQTTEIAKPQHSCHGRRRMLCTEESGTSSEE